MGSTGRSSFYLNAGYLIAVRVASRLRAAAGDSSRNASCTKIMSTLTCATLVDHHSLADRSFPLHEASRDRRPAAHGASGYHTEAAGAVGRSCRPGSV